MAEETKDSTVIPVLGGDRPDSPLPRTPGRLGPEPPTEIDLGADSDDDFLDEYLKRNPRHARQFAKTMGENWSWERRNDTMRAWTGSNLRRDLWPDP